MAYNLSNLNYGGYSNFSSVFSLGQGNSTENARYALTDQIHLITTNTTTYNITDMMVLSAHYNRMGEKGVAFKSDALVINIGNVIKPEVQVAFMVNRTNDQNVLEIYSLIYKVSLFSEEQIWYALPSESLNRV